MPLLEVRGLDGFHGDFQALHGLDFEIDEREAVAIVGANGAGKSTLLAAILGSLSGTKGTIRFDQRDLLGLPPYGIAREGIALVPEGRRLFPSLSVRENIEIGAATGRTGDWTTDRIRELFPALKRLWDMPVGRISGGQQQMVSIGRALMLQPRLLLCDEISLGLAPKVVGEIYECFSAIREGGVALVLVEQDVARARSETDRLYCLLEGRFCLSGVSSELSLTDISNAYFGV